MQGPRFCLDCRASKYLCDPVSTVQPEGKMKKFIFIMFVLLLCVSSICSAYTWEVIQDFQDENKKKRVAIFRALEDSRVIMLFPIGRDWLTVKGEALSWLQDNEPVNGWVIYNSNLTQKKAYTEFFSSRDKCEFNLSELTVCPTFESCNMENVAPPDCSYSEGKLIDNRYRGVEFYGCTSNTPNDGPLQCDFCETKEICSECLANCPVDRQCKWCRHQLNYDPENLPPTPEWGPYGCLPGDVTGGEDCECVESCQ